MKKNVSRIIGLVMLVIAICFVSFALRHPEMSWPLDIKITRLLYGFYVFAMIIFLIAPKKKK